MSRIQYPSEFGQQLTLATAVKAKNDTDGTNSPLLPYLSGQSISLDADATAATDAKTHDDVRISLTKQAQNYTQLRDLKLKPINSFLKGSVQFLKSLFKPNFKVLGEWGVTIDNNGKVNYATDAVSVNNLFMTVQKKHESYPDGISPLQPYLAQNKVDLGILSDSMASAMDFQSRLGQSSKDAEHETEQRNLIWAPVEAHLHGIGDYLKKLFDPNTKALGQWGFVINDSPTAPKERISTIKPGEKITTSGIVLGSTFTNHGNAELHIYKGKTASGNPTIVQSGETFGILKGHSTITVSNPSLQEIAKFKVIIAR